MTAHIDVQTPLDPAAPRRETGALSGTAGPETALSGTGRAAAKAILFGEHAVVYGAPAIAVPVWSLGATATATRRGHTNRLDSALYHGEVATAPLRLGVTATALDAALRALGSPNDAVYVHIDSSIPAERGLGSSAAVAAAVVEAVADAWGRTLDPDEMFALVQEAERTAHGTPSGLDARAVRARGPIWFESKTATALPLARDLQLVIADTGVRGRTREAVARVAARRGDAPAATNALIDRLAALAIDARPMLERGDLVGVGAAMNEAHTALTSLGVGEASLDRLAGIARRAGALGAKLTGGGLGGCLLALADDEDAAREIAERLHDAGASAVHSSVVRSLQ